MHIFKTCIASQRRYKKALSYAQMFLLLPNMETSMFFNFSLLFLLSNEVKTCPLGLVISYKNLGFPWECSSSNQIRKLSKITSTN